MSLFPSIVSVTLIYSAMAVYAIALVAFTADLAKRAAPLAVVPSASRSTVAVGAAGSSSVDTAVRVQTEVQAHAVHPAGSSRAGRIAVALTALAWLIHLAGVVLRGISAQRVPWANMYEFSITSTLIIVGVFLLMQLRLNIRYLGTFVVGLMLVLLGVGAVGFYVDVIPLPPALQSAWLVIHVLVAMTATALFAVSFAVSALQIAQSRNVGGSRSLGATVRAKFSRLLKTVPDAETLDAMAYRIIIVGFILWTFTLMAGAIWANRAWGRYWGWDVKEVWTFIVWVIYAAYIHAKATRGWNGTRAAWLAIVGFGAVMFNFGVVNIFFKGLHSYSGL
ncbi:MAG: c-type cytochrome biogenesis protein CcsB [Actinomycetota bacterium]